MPRKLPTLGELEIQVLRLVWREQPCSERQVSDLIQAERPVARTTVLKTIQRLEAKRLLKRVPGEGPVRFQAVHDEQRVLPELIRRFVDSVLGGRSNPLVAYLADAEGLTQKDVKALREIARKLDASPDTTREDGE